MNLVRLQFLFQDWKLEGLWLERELKNKRPILFDSRIHAPLKSTSGFFFFLLLFFRG